jgi:ribosomal protein L32
METDEVKIDECENCGRLDGEHACCECGFDLTEKECQEHLGLCETCEWLLDK